MTISWEYGVVAFIDVLGFSALVASDSKSPEPVHLERLRASLREVKEAASNLDIRAFSDSIIVSSPLTVAHATHLMLSVANLQRIFVRRSVLVRGAIAFGKHFADADLIYSEGLIQAYEDERKDARFPRILVNRNLLDWLTNEQSATTETMSPIWPLLMLDRDNQVFLNYLLEQDLPLHLSLIAGYDMSGMASSVLEKVQWLAAYHNHLANGLKSEHTFSGPLLHGFRPFTKSTR